MPKSIINSDYEFDNDMWVISVLYVGSMTRNGQLRGGHSMIVVEGIVNKTSGILNDLFFGRYDIRAQPYEIQVDSLNIKGYISEVCTHEDNKYDKDYTTYPSKSYVVSAINAQSMIRSIQADKNITAQLNNKIIHGIIEKDDIDSEYIHNNGYLEYQFVGKNSFFANEGRGDNCAGWTLEKLSHAGIGDGSGKPKPAMLVQQCTIL